MEQAGRLHEAHKPTSSERVGAAIREALLEHGEYHSDCLAALDLPPADLNCIGSQVSLALREGIMEHVGTRRNRAAASNSRRSGVYKITDLGRDRLAGVRSDNREGTAVADTGTLDRPGADSVRAPYAGARSSLTADPGEDSSAAITGAAGEDRADSEALSLFPSPPKLLDHDQPRAA